MKAGSSYGGAARQPSRGRILGLDAVPVPESHSPLAVLLVDSSRAQTQRQACPSPLLVGMLQASLDGQAFDACESPRRPRGFFLA